MFAVGELVFYGRTGVCRVAEVLSDAPEGPVFYALQPLYQTCAIRIPANNPKVYLRTIACRAEADALLAELPALEAEPYYNRNLNQLRAYYLSCLENRSCRDLARMVKSLYLKKAELEAQKKKFGAVDERFLREAEGLLYGELAAALTLDRAEVQKLIAKSMELA